MYCVSVIHPSIHPLDRARKKKRKESLSHIICRHAQLDDDKGRFLQRASCRFAEYIETKNRQRFTSPHYLASLRWKNVTALLRGRDEVMPGLVGAHPRPLRVEDGEGRRGNLDDAAVGFGDCFREEGGLGGGEERWTRRCGGGRFCGGGPFLGGRVFGEGWTTSGRSSGWFLGGGWMTRRCGFLCGGGLHGLTC